MLEPKNRRYVTSTNQNRAQSSLPGPRELSKGHTVNLPTEATEGTCGVKGSDTMMLLIYKKKTLWVMSCGPVLRHREETCVPPMGTLG